MACAVAAALLRVVGATLRLRVHDTVVGPLIGQGSPLIFALWHSQLLIGPYCYARRFPSLKVKALVSRSRDGEILSMFLARFGVEAVRGSSSRGGALAARHLRRTLEQGWSVIVVPDGPRGPREVVKPGVITLARLSGAPIIPAAVGYSSWWEARSWDRLMIPKPFARCVIRFGGPVRVPPDADAGAEAVLARDLESTLQALGSSARSEAAA
jgi:hypothetical protein